MARDVTVFTDDSCVIAGPVRSGPSLGEWAERVREGRLPDVEIDDPDLLAEVEALRGDSFPTRRLQSLYLDWFWRRTVAIAPPGVEVRWQPGTVQWVDDVPDGWEVALADGTRLGADVVVYALGHNGREPESTALDLSAAAAAAGFSYLEPAFTADADLSRLAPGADVIVRGWGWPRWMPSCCSPRGAAAGSRAAPTARSSTRRRVASRGCTSDRAGACRTGRR